MNKILENDFEILKIPAAVYVPAGGGETVHMNRKFHGAVYNEAGEKRYRFAGGEVVTVRAREFLYLPKASDYVVTIVEPGGCYAINFDVAGDLCEPGFSMRLKNPSALRGYFAAAEREYRTKKAGSGMRCMANLYNIFAGLQSEYDAEYMTNSKLSIIAPAEVYIGEHYTSETIDVGYLAEICGISEVYLRKIFVSKYGVSPLRYINMLKIGRARSLLDTGLYSIGKVAELSGFGNECYFSREFKKRLGVSPKMYKERTLRR